MTDANQHIFDLVDGNKKPPKRPVSVFGIVILVVLVVGFLVAFVDLDPTKEAPATAQASSKPQA